MKKNEKDVIVNVIVSSIRRPKWVVIFKNTWNQAEKKFYSREAMEKFINKNKLNILNEIEVLM